LLVTTVLVGSVLLAIVGRSRNLAGRWTQPDASWFGHGVV